MDVARNKLPAKEMKIDTLENDAANPLTLSPKSSYGSNITPSQLVNLIHGGQFPTSQN